MEHASSRVEDSANAANVLEPILEIAAPEVGAFSSDIKAKYNWASAPEEMVLFFGSCFIGTF
jgi:hypothetical protein